MYNAIQHLDPNIKDLVVFGSVARGDADKRSDFDVLGIVEDGKKPIHGNILVELLESEYGMHPQVSWYSARRIAEMFSEGHLFAWHLFLEATPARGIMCHGFLVSLGKPSEYTDYRKDLHVLVELLDSIGDCIRKAPKNLCYEAGLIYVCARNIALAASWLTPSGLDFSRYSPFNLGLPTVHFPIQRKDYDDLILARHATTRGAKAPHLDVETMLAHHSKVIEWAARIKVLLAKGQ